MIADLTILLVGPLFLKLCIESIASGEVVGRDCGISQVWSSGDVTELV